MHTPGAHQIIALAWRLNACRVTSFNQIKPKVDFLFHPYFPPAIALAISINVDKWQIIYQNFNKKLMWV